MSTFEKFVEVMCDVKGIRIEYGIELRYTRVGRYYVGNIFEITPDSDNKSYNFIYKPLDEGGHQIHMHIDNVISKYEKGSINIHLTKDIISIENHKHSEYNLVNQFIKSCIDEFLESLDEFMSTQMDKLELD